MFVAIDNLVTPDSPLKITVLRGPDGTLKVFVMPSEGKNPLLKQPLALCATPAELDEGFVAAVSAYSAGRNGLAEQVAATEAILAQAKQSEAGKATKALKGKSVPTAGDSGADEEEEEDEKGGTSQPSSPPAPTPPAPAAANKQDGGLLELFGED